MPSDSQSTALPSRKEKAALKPDALSLTEALAITLPRRQDTIDRMLVDFADVQNTLNSGRGGSGSGWGFLMPAVWTKPYERLNHFRRQLHRDGPQYVVYGDCFGTTTRRLVWWLNEFYLRAPRVQRPKRRRVKGREMAVYVEGKPQYELVAVRPADFDLRRVLEALEWIDDAWSLADPTQPEFLTPERWERLLNPPHTQAA